MNTKATSRVKGTKITSKLTFLRKEYGDAMVERVLASLEPADQAKARSALTHKDYDQGAWKP